MLLVTFKKWLDKKKVGRPRHAEHEMLEKKVARIQQGDSHLRNELISDYKPFIAKITSRFCKKYINPERDDEFSIAMSAFNEAINQYSDKAGGSFLGFAQTVIRRRLIDHIRKEQRHYAHIPLSAFDVEDEDHHIVNPVENQLALEQFERENLVTERQGEIAELNHALSEFGISFAELAKVSPKHADSRKMLFKIGKLLARDRQMMEGLMQKKLLPIKPLQARSGVSRKTLERNRKYLIAIALIHTGHYPHLREYLHTFGEEEDDE